MLQLSDQEKRKLQHGFSRLRKAVQWAANVLSLVQESGAYDTVTLSEAEVCGHPSQQQQQETSERASKQMPKQTIKQACERASERANRCPNKPTNKRAHKWHSIHTHILTHTHTYTHTQTHTHTHTLSLSPSLPPPRRTLAGFQGCMRLSAKTGRRHRRLSCGAKSCICSLSSSLPTRRSRRFTSV